MEPGLIHLWMSTVRLESLSTVRLESGFSLLNPGQKELIDYNDIVLNT